MVKAMVKEVLRCLLNRPPQYEGHYGYEIEMMEEAGRVLNFEYAVTNPPDQGWGIIQEDYRWTHLDD